MKTTFKRIYSSDGLELHGLLYEPEDLTESILVHVHGMGGNFYENKFLDFIAEKLTASGIAFCVFNNRGCEFIKELMMIEGGAEPKIIRKGASYEMFEESVLDIKAVIDYVSRNGFSDIHLSGHSLGCSKAVYYMAETADNRIKSLLLLSPSDMLGLVRSNKERFEKERTEAVELVRLGKSEVLLSTWVWDEYPISAETYLSLFANDAKTAIFNFYNPEDKLEELQKISIPTYAVMGRLDGALVISIEETFARIESALISSPRVKTEILGDANHGYRGHEEELADAINLWFSEINSPKERSLRLER